MWIEKKVSNNIALAKDRNGRPVVVFGKGIGFHKMPYELKDYSLIDRTFYDVDQKDLALLSEISPKVLLVTTRLVDTARERLPLKPGSGLVFSLADHIQFALRRDRDDLHVDIPYSHELEFEHPDVVAVARWMVETLNSLFGSNLERGEATNISMHLLGALRGEARSRQGRSDGDEILNNAIALIEGAFDISVKRESYDFMRFKRHLFALVERSGDQAPQDATNARLAEAIRAEQPNVWDCALQLGSLCLSDGSRLSDDELLYLVIHINRLLMASKDSQG